MKRICLLPLFLLFIYTASAQKLRWYGADSAFIRQVELPQISDKKLRSWDAGPGDYVYMFSYMDFYRLFDVDTFYYRYHDFDFSNYHILGQTVCEQCMAVCRHGQGEKNCHRNRCQYSTMWTVRSNEKAFQKIPYTMTPFPQQKQLYGDTVVMPVSPADSGKVRWGTHGRGDCHARFRYELDADKYYPVTVLREYNYYGGCRAGGGKYSELKFSFIPGKTIYRKKTILMDRDGRRE